MLAEFAAMLARPEDLASVRRQLVTRMLSARQRLQLAMAVVCSSLDATIEAICKQLDAAEARMVSHVQAHFAELEKLLRSGPVVSARWPVPR